MPQQTLIEHLRLFLQKPYVVALCRRYGADPTAALGELYLRLSTGARTPIRNPTNWVGINATGLLRNFLRREYRPLRQARED